MLDLYGIEANKRALLEDLKQLIEEALQPFADDLREFLQRVRARQFGSDWRGAWDNFVETQTEAGFNIEADSATRLVRLMESWERQVPMGRVVPVATGLKQPGLIVIAPDQVQPGTVIEAVRGYHLDSARFSDRVNPVDQGGGDSLSRQNASDLTNEFRFRVYDIARRGAEDENKVIGDLKLTLNVDASPCTIDANGRCRGRVFLSLFFDWTPQTVHPEQNPLSTGTYMLADDTHSVTIKYSPSRHSVARFPIIQPKLPSPMKTPCGGFTLDRVLRVHGINTTSIEPIAIDLFRIKIHVEVGPCGKKRAQNVTLELSNQLLNAGVRPPDEI